MVALERAVGHTEAALPKKTVAAAFERAVTVLSWESAVVAFGHAATALP
ncbi:MAG: hypothetical protein QWI73_07165 [Alphaproteobacteria bacterium]|nr:hypothetical protein [Alphaproteobacteria bacterium]